MATHAAATATKDTPSSISEGLNISTLAWGANENGQLGVGDVVARIRPHVISRAIAPAKIVCGSRFSLILSKEGSLFSHGRGDDGQLGYNTNIQTHPRVIPAFLDKKIVNIATRGSHALAVTSEGDVYAWGRADDGQLGDISSTTDNRGVSNENSHRTSIPRKVKSLPERIGLIACGRMFSVAVTINFKSIYTWGCGDDGSLGHGTFESTTIPRKIKGFPIVDDVVDVCCGSRHALCQLSDGSLFAWGWGIYGQLGTGDRENRALPTFVSFPTFGSLTNLDGRRASQMMPLVASAPRLAVPEMKQNFQSSLDVESGSGNDILFESSAQTISSPAHVRINENHYFGRTESSTTTTQYDHNLSVKQAARNGGFVARDIHANAEFNRRQKASPRMRANSDPTCSTPTKGAIINYISYAVIKIAAGYRHNICCVRVLSPLEKCLLADGKFNLRSDKFAHTADATHSPNTVETFAWGWNQYGQVGIDVTDLHQNTISSKLYDTPALGAVRNAHKGYCLRPHPVAGLRGKPVLALAAGGRHTLCVVAATANVSGQSHANCASRRNSNQSSISSNSSHFANNLGSTDTHSIQLQLQPTLHLYAWGRGNDGQLGLPSLNSSRKPVQVLSGMMLPNRTVADIHISCGWAHNCAVLALESSNITNLQTSPDLALSNAPKHCWLDPRGWSVILTSFYYDFCNFYELDTKCFRPFYS